MRSKQEKINKLREIITALHRTDNEPDWERVYEEIAQVILSALFKGDEEGLLTAESRREIEKRFVYSKIQFRAFDELLDAYLKAQQLLDQVKLEEAVKADHAIMVKFAVDEGNDAYKRGVKAERERIIEWLNEPCPHLFNFNTRWGCRACQDFLKEKIND